LPGARASAQAQAPVALDLADARTRQAQRGSAHGAGEQCSTRQGSAKPKGDENVDDRAECGPRRHGCPAHAGTRRAAKVTT
jgi:hypothetical protein